MRWRDERPHRPYTARDCRYPHHVVAESNQTIPEHAGLPSGAAILPRQRHRSDVAAQNRADWGNHGPNADGVSLGACGTSGRARLKTPDVFDGGAQVDSSASTERQQYIGVPPNGEPLG